MTKRVISFLLILVMLTGMLPVFAQAEEAQTSVDSGDVTVEGTNGFGTLLAEDIAQEQESLEEQQTSGYTLTDLQITGNIATVTYDSLEEATVVVALYTEDGMQLLTSGKTTVNPEETTATVTIEGEMPQYFMASAYLLDTYDMSPLCPAYDTPMYTQEMQELLASTAEDYDPDRVLQLEESPETNFAVYAETTKVIEKVEGVNTVASVDEESNTYIIENADENITSLQVGDVFAYPYDVNEVLIVKVGTITVDGTTVTITSVDLELNEAFSHVKIEGLSGTEELTVDDSTAAEGITYEGMIAEGNTARSFTGESTAKLSHKINLEQKIEEETDHLSASASISGSLKFQLAVCVKYYVSLELRYIEFKITPSVVADITIQGKISGKQPLGTFEVSPVPTVKVGFEPKLELTFSGKVNLNCTLSATIGFRYDSEVGLKNISTRPKFTPNLDVEITMFLGIDFGPKITLLGDDTVKLGLSASVGVELKGKAKGTNYEFLTGKETQRHTCKECLEITMTFKAKLSGNIKFFDSEKWKVNVDIGNWSVPLGKAYYSLDHERFGLGTCPYLEYRLTVTVKEAGLTPLSGIAVNTSTGKTLGITNSNGVLVGYLPIGFYRLSVYANEKTTIKDITVIDAAYISINVPKKSSEADKADQEDILWNVTEDDCLDIGIVDYGTVVAAGTCGSNLTWLLYGSGTMYIRGEGAMWFQSSAPWKYKSDKIKRVVISPGVTQIYRYAFSGCKKMVSINIPDSVYCIGEGAFKECSSLTNLTIPAGVTQINDTTFKDCSSLTSVSVPDSVTSIGASAFRGCNNLSGITIPTGVTSIGAYAFYGCERLTGITIPYGVTSIGKSAFYDCKSLVTVTLPTGVNCIAEKMFYNCQSLSSIIIPEGVTRIGTDAFRYCSSLTDLTIADGVTSIGNAAFYNCSSLLSAILPNGVTSIGTEAFYNCSSLASAVLPDSVTNIGTGAFCGCRSLPSVTLPKGILSISDSLFFNCSNLNDIIIPESVTSIGDSAFYNCISLSAMEIPEGVTSIGDSAFRGCISLTSMIIPESGVNIGDSAFYDCSSLPGIILPQDITEVGDHVFHNCQSLSSIILPETITSIGEAAFRGCSSLTELTIPAGVTSIGGYAFYGCSGLCSMIIPDGVTCMNYYLFENCSSLTSVVIPQSVTKIDYNVFSGCSRLTSITIPDGVTYIGSHAFSYCGSLSDIALPDGITSIGSGTFNECNSLTSFVIPDGVTKLGDWAFQKCTNLTSITVPDSVTEIGQWAFSGCHSLKNIIISNSITACRYGTFESCESLTSITLPDGVISIGTNTFNCCSRLSSITIPSTVTQIGNGAFRYCDRLTDVYYTGTQEQWEALAIGTGNERLLNAAIHYNSTVAATQVSSEITAAPSFGGTLTGHSGSQISSSNAIFGGTFNTEVTDTYTVRNADFSNLVPGKEYVLLAMISLDTEDPLSSENLLFIDQAAAAEDGTLSFRYVQRVNTEPAFVMACGASTKDLADAVITFPEMNADVETQVVQPTVVYDGKTLTEGQDYVISGDVDFAEAGEYTCYIRGIYGYTGLVTCTYTVGESGLSLSGSVSTGSGEETVVELLLDGSMVATVIVCGETGSYRFGTITSGTYTLQISKQKHVSQSYEVVVTDEDIVQDVKLHLIGDVNGDGKVNVADVSKMYAHSRKTDTLVGYEFLCAEINGDGRVNVADVSKAYAHARKTAPLW